MSINNSAQRRARVSRRCLSLTLLLFVVPGSSEASGQCTETVRSVFTDPSGLTFTVAETDCDSLGNDAAVTISASEKGSQPVVLAKYGPDERSRPPHIVVESGKTIVISIDSVAELFRQEARYGSYTVVYNIGHVEYPHAEKDVTGKKT